MKAVCQLGSLAGIELAYMISDEQIRTDCATVAAAIAVDPEDLEQLQVGLKMLCTQYIRERSIHLAYSSPSAE